MLAIGRGLMIQPKILMLDEPSLGLAPIVGEDIFRKIQEVNAQGTTILLIEQNANLALSVCDCPYLLSVGSIVLQGTPQAIKDEGQLLNAYLGGRTDRHGAALSPNGAGIRTASITWKEPR